MRLLDDEILDLIGGGMDYVYVYGSTPIFDPNPYTPGPTSPGGPSPQGEHTYTPSAEHHCHHSSAPSDKPPEGNLDDIRNLALDLADKIKQLDPSFEHAAMLISDQYGNIRASAISSSTSTTSFKLEADLYVNERVVGYIHSHPDVAGVDERTMSTPSTAANPQDADTLQAAKLFLNKMSDPNLFAYILDNKSGDTFEYPATEASVNDKRPIGPNITKDVVPCG